MLRAAAWERWAGRIFGRFSHSSTLTGGQGVTAPLEAIDNIENVTGADFMDAHLAQRCVHVVMKVVLRREGRKH